MAPDFNNTEQAFRHLSDAELRKALLLFRTVGSPTLVRLGKVLMNVALALRIPVGWAIRPTVYAHFCGGETIAESEGTVAQLARGRVHTILDYSAEGKESEKELDATRDEVLAAIDAAQGDERHAFSVFKVSGVAPTPVLRDPGSDPAAWERVKARVAALCGRAAETGGRIFIDAEETWFQGAIDALAEEQMSRLNRERAVVFNTVQLYRHDRLAYLKALTERAQREGWHLGVKLVRGAYMEKEREKAAEAGKPSPIQPDKAASDRDYDAALAWCIDHGVSVCSGSHNVASNALLCELMERAGLEPGDDRVWFAQLLGMSDPISFNLAASGYNVAKYVPYGPIREAIPYLIRRAEENTSVAGQTSRELSLLRAEVQRRKAT